MATRTTTNRVWIMRVAALTLALLVCEAALQAASLVSPGVRRVLLPEHLRDGVTATTPPQFFKDPVLGHRGNPEHPALDANGLHNAQVPPRVDVVAIGDSQTFGLIGQPEHSWPGHFESMTGHDTYNMALGGWGPVEYLVVLEDALRMQPRSVVVAFYLGNDLFDAYQAVYVHGRQEELRTPGAPESIQPQEDGAGMLDEIREFVTTGQGAGESSRPVGFVRACRSFLSQRCKLYGAARAIKDCLAAAIDPERVARAEADRRWQRHVRWARRHPDIGCPFEQGTYRTILTPPLRNLVLDLLDPRVEEGLRISMRTMEACHARCREAGVEFHLVLIPTKESVFHELESGESAPAEMRKLVRNETQVRARFVAFLDEHNIPFTDSLPLLRDCLRRGEQPYPIGRDGHPNSTGYRAIAESVAGRVPTILASASDSRP